MWNYFVIGNPLNLIFNEIPRCVGATYTFLLRQLTSHFLHELCTFAHPFLYQSKCFPVLPTYFKQLPIPQIHTYIEL